MKRTKKWLLRILMYVPVPALFLVLSSIGIIRHKSVIAIGICLVLVVVPSIVYWRFEKREGITPECITAFKAILMPTLADLIPVAMFVWIWPTPLGFLKALAICSSIKLLFTGTVVPIVLPARRRAANWVERNTAIRSIHY